MRREQGVKQKRGDGRWINMPENKGIVSVVGRGVLLEQ